MLGSRCGNGVIDAGEQCDDGNQTPGDCCSPTCTFEGSGSACTSDGNVCTDDVCDGAGTCQHQNNTAPCTVSDGCVGGTCGGGTCAASGPLPAGTACDSDANVCTLETCDGAGTCGTPVALECAPCGTCEPARGCVGYPDACYLAPKKGSITLRAGSPAANRATWTWAGAFANFGDPTSTTDYTLCVFENDMTETPGVILRATAPAGGICASGACWKATPNGFAYKDHDLTPEGVLSIKLKAATKPGGTSQIAIKGKGANLALPATLPVNVEVLAQLHAIDGSTSSVCWNTDFPTPSKSTPFTFKAKAFVP